ncbi:Calx-beta domain-containing protein [Leptolyngbya sp. ST-U4]|uniref:Calx-beta domain-containing protein n=1 Tax=Leptolyngbya sp. ST-U4 TaxID=2933912 RepID=UPI0019BD9DF4|nr:hypothetical protein [Cyanobacteria bacterium FACHB-502]
MTDYNEAINGDLSSNSAVPTNIALSPGSNVITGTTIGGGNPPGDRDFFTFVVPAGSTVTAIGLQSYSGASNSYFALTPGSAFPSLTDASTFSVSKLIDTDEIGQDLLEPSVGVAAGPAGTGQLGPGTYSVWYQETGANTAYAFNVVLDTPPPGQIQFGSNAIQVNEAAGTASITLTRTGGSSGAVSVQLNSTGGTAQNSLDYNLAAPLTVNFANGETQRVISVPIVNDALVEGNETALFALANPTGGATLGATTQTTLTIVDNDIAPPNSGQIQFGSNTIQVNEADGTASITLTRTGGSSGAVSVQLNSTGGTAQNLLDYNLAAPLTVNFANGETQQVVSVPIVNDILVEGNETALFTLTNPTGGATLGATTQTTLTVVDNEKILMGTDAPDILVGGLENDYIFGKRGRDRLTGGGGNDQLTGGSGKDRFIFDINSPFNAVTMGVDVITDFRRGKDKIVLDRTTFTQLDRRISFATVRNETRAQNSNALITYVRSSGNLYYNENRSAAGFGTGGLFATLSNFSSPDAALSRSDFGVSS